MSCTYALSGMAMWDVNGMMDRMPDPGSTILIAETRGGITWFYSWKKGPTCPDFLEWKGQMHFQSALSGTDDWGYPAISAQISAIAVDGHARSIHMTNSHGGTDGPWDGMYCRR
ncbi:MAG: hypothetical protein NVSMB52_07000 [Chloroflexota bacterium]